METKTYSILYVCVRWLMGFSLFHYFWYQTGCGRWFCCFCSMFLALVYEQISTQGCFHFHCKIFCSLFTAWISDPSSTFVHFQMRYKQKDQTEEHFELNIWFIRTDPSSSSFKEFFVSKILIEMGLSSLPAPSEGVLGVILVNTAISISIFKGIVRSILHVVGIHLSAPSSSDSMENSPESIDFCLNPNGGYIEEFRSRIPAILFDKVRSCKWLEHDCSVCLTQFEPESEINHLSCGHVFHRVCLEKWLDYWNVTCPLCRTPLMPEEETASCFWWALWTLWTHYG